MNNNSFVEIYSVFKKEYGRQGWWPVYNTEKGRCEYGTNAPNNDDDRFEIVIGAILTQNVAWVNVEKALGALKQNKILTPRKLHKADNELIAQCIRPTGYFNQKTIKIKNFLNWFKEYQYSFDVISRIKTLKLRESLLSVSGIGPETADSILLYAMKRKIFVVDAYTKRIYSRLNIISAEDNYESVQSRFHREFSGTLRGYNEYHALIVAHGKDICKNKPLCSECCISNRCDYFHNTNI